MCDVQKIAGKCLNCKKPLCVAGCPVGYNIPLFLQQAKSGDISAAQQTVGHLFGEICGYVCPREIQCRGHCVLNKRGVPVDAGRVEREIFAKNPQLKRQNENLVDCEIAVVGGGVAGITFAAEMYKNGASVTVFERAELLHTLKSIPDFRLPREAIEKIAENVEKSDIEIIKQDVSAEEFQKICSRFDAVFLATGVTVPHKMNVVGEEFATLGDDFLRGNTFGETIVVGGGNTAMDCARLNVRRGFKTTVAYRRTRADMPAFETEINCAMAENVEFKFNIAPVSVEKINNKLKVTFAETVSEGRGKLVLTENFVMLDCDILVLALGNVYDRSIFGDDKYVLTDEKGYVGQNIFAGGDAVGHSLVAQAVADGLKASAEAILRLSKR